MAVISNIVSTSVQSFVDYALWIVGIMIIYYIVKFFVAAEPPSKEEKAAEEVRAKEWWEDFFKKREEKKGKAGKAASEKRRKESVLPVLDNLEKAVEVAGELQIHLFKDEREEAVAQAKKLAVLAKKAWKNVHLLLRKFEGDERKKLTQLYNGLAVVEEKVEKDIKKKFPKNVLKATNADWNTAVTAIEPELKKVTAALEAVWNDLEEFYKE